MDTSEEELEPMESRLHSMDTMQMGVRLPLPSDNHPIRVEITAPTYRSIEVTEETHLGVIKAVDFSALYEWASREATITGYSKLYLLGGYILNYCNGTGEPTEGTNKNQLVKLRIDLGEQKIEIETLNLEEGQEFMGHLYRIIREYETYLHDMILASDIEEIQMEERINWQEPIESLPALLREIAPEPDPFSWEEEPLPDLIDLGNGNYITRGKLIAEYEQLKAENNELKDIRDSRYGKYVELFKQMMNGNDSGVGFVALCLEEIQSQIHNAASAHDCFQALHVTSERMEEGAKLWNAIAEALKSLSPKPIPKVAPKPVAEVHNCKVVSNDFRDVSQFVFACAGYALDEKKPLRVRVFKDSLDNEIGKFDWKPNDSGMEYNPQEAKAFVLAMLMESELSLTSGCHHLTAFAPNSDECIAAHTVWL